MSTRGLQFSGWRVDNAKLPSDPAVAAAVDTIRRHFGCAAAILPDKVRLETRKARILLREETTSNKEGPMTFHWKGHQFEGCLEIHHATRVARRLDWEWGGAIIHELGHAFHFYGVPGDENNSSVNNRFQISRHLSCYTNSTNIETLNKEPSYAIQKGDQREYFACLFASYFNANNYTPVSRENLQRDDPEGFALIHSLISGP
jgi:hypothetical protein